MLRKTLAIIISGIKRGRRLFGRTGRLVRRHRWLTLTVLLAALLTMPGYMLMNVLSKDYSPQEVQIPAEGDLTDSTWVPAVKESASAQKGVDEEGVSANSAEAGDSEAGAEAAPEEEVILSEMVLPATGNLIFAHGFAYSEVFQDYRFHNGVDLSIQRDMPVAAVLAGEVTEVEYSELFGYRVTVDHGAGWVSRYAHLAQVTAEKGQQVGAGEELGKVGDPGSAEQDRGTHLHLELLEHGTAVDPAAYLTLTGK